MTIASKKRNYRLKNATITVTITTMMTANPVAMVVGILPASPSRKAFSHVSSKEMKDKMQEAKNNDHPSTQAYTY